MVKTSKIKARNPQLQTSPDSLDVERYNSIARSARLAEIVLSRSDFYAKLGASLALSDPEASVKLGYGDDLVDAAFDDSVGAVFGTFNWRAEIKEGRTTLVRLRASYSIFYEGLEAADGTHALAYLAKVGRFATYPYFRGMFSVHAGAAGLVIPPLPSLKERVD